MTTAFVTDAIFRQHDPGWDHPEAPERYDAVLRALQHEGLLDYMHPLVPRLATEEELGWCHARPYLAQARHEIESGQTTVLSSGDTAVSYRSWEVARYAVGSVFRAIDTLYAGGARNAFCLVRPPGHHATARRGMGFCIFNNIALGARYAQRTHKVKRVAIIDWDVHHGNGTQDLFYEDPTVFYFSVHQAPLYPFTGWPEETGQGPGVGANLNVALPAGAGRAEIVEAFDTQLAPALETFKPELILLSAGFDGHVDDPIGQWTLTEADYRDLTTRVMALAAQHSQHRLVSVLEGGYNLTALAHSTTEHVRELIFGHQD